MLESPMANDVLVLSYILCKLVIGRYHITLGSGIWNIYNVLIYVISFCPKQVITLCYVPMSIPLLTGLVDRVWIATDCAFCIFSPQVYFVVQESIYNNFQCSARCLEKGISSFPIVPFSLKSNSFYCRLLRNNELFLFLFIWTKNIKQLKIMIQIDLPTSKFLSGKIALLTAET